MSAIELFSALVAGDEQAIPLDEAALLIAACAYPDLDVAAQLARLDDLAAACPEPTIDGLWRHLFVDLGFAGDTGTYADPRNSFLNEVLDRRRGIPISLSVLAIAVGRRLGVELAGVGMPGHFLVRAVSGEVLDPFGLRRGMDSAACAELFHRVHGREAPFDERYLAPVGTRAVLVRMLANLRHRYQAVGDARAAGWVYRLRAVVPVCSAADRVDVARVLSSLGRFEEAADTLDALADSVAGDGATAARSQAVALRARLN